MNEQATVPMGAKLDTQADIDRLRGTLDSAVVEDAFGDARSPQETVTLPSGLLREVTEGVSGDGAIKKVYRLAVIREMTGVEEDLVMDASMPADARLASLMANCIDVFLSEDGERVDDRAEIARAVRSELPTVDRTYLILRMRILSLGHLYNFDGKCASCGTTEQKTIDLRDLEMRPALEPEKRVFEVALPSGKKARWRVPTGADESALARRVGRGNDLMTRILEMRVFEVNEQPATYDVLRRLPMRDRHALRRDIDAREGHIDTTVDVTCTSCSSKYEVTVGIAGPSFFFPTLR